jgi:hypothetical protein
MWHLFADDVSDGHTADLRIEAFGGDDGELFGDEQVEVRPFRPLPGHEVERHAVHVRRRACAEWLVRRRFANASLQKS